MKDIEIQSEIKRLHSLAINEKRPCLYPNCEKTSINSHLLQKNGVISEIAEKGHVHVIDHNIFSRPRTRFISKGVNKAFAFPGFCNTHDTELFYQIEKPDTDFSLYNSQILLSLRAHLIERRKKEIMIDYYKSILESEKLRNNIDSNFFLDVNENIKGEQLGIKDSLYCENRFFKDLENNEKSFVFLTKELKRVDVCVSAVFTYETSNEINRMSLLNPKGYNEPLSDIFFNFFPIQNKSVLIIGCLIEKQNKCWKYINDIVAGEDELVLTNISDLLINQLENWITSSTFYHKIIQPKEADFFKLYFTENYNERSKLNFSLFAAPN